MHLATAPSRSAVVGAWDTVDGRGRIRPDADGRFRAAALPAEVFALGRRVDGTTSTTAPGS
ncbi:hypothetical protein [Streptomyces carpinensis]|uniref:hypothetical protein n=1 Tax=Streptomyces carpinensis TaxID=66369 RepID=UPI000A39F630|nr:hypothetical protein [Streptomyces carpinensis]